MSNNRNLGNIATAITNATSGQVLTSQGNGVATFADAGGGVTYYANVSDLPASGNSNGDAAFVGSNNRLYIFNGAGWYSVALLNQTPTFNSIQDASSGTTPFTLSNSGTATVITVTATDAEGQALTYNYSVSSGTLNGSTVAKGTGANYNITYASKLSGTNSVSANLGALTFKPDGTEMYNVSTNNDRVNRHTLSTDWNVSTASYVGSSPNTLSQASQLKDVKFNNDGTKMYMGDRDNTIYQYSLDPAWDTDTASYDNKSYDFSSVLTGGELGCFVFNGDGSAVYLAEHYPNQKIYQFSLTNFDISTASYSNKNLDFASEAVGRPYFQFTNDGKKLFMINTFHTAGFVGKVYEYSLTTAYDVSTASYTGVSYTPAGITTDRSALAFKPDGTKMFIMGTDNHTTTSQFDLPVYNTNDFIVQPHASNSTTFDLTFTASDGVNTATSTAQAFTLSFTPNWNQSASVMYSTWPSTIYSDTVYSGNVNGGFWFNSAGTKMILSDSEGATHGGQGRLKEYTLSTEWNHTTASFSQNGDQYIYANSGFDLTGNGLTVVYGDSSDQVKYTNLSTAFDTSVRSGTRQNGPQVSMTVRDVKFSYDGSKFFVLHGTSSTNPQIWTYNLSSAYDISSSSATLDSTKTWTPNSTFSEMQSTNHFQFNPTGTVLYASSQFGAHNFISFPLTAAWDLSTISSYVEGGNLYIPNMFRFFIRPDTGDEIYASKDNTTSGTQTIYSRRSS